MPLSSSGLSTAPRGTRWDNGEGLSATGHSPRDLRLRSSAGLPENPGDISLARGYCVGVRAFSWDTRHIPRRS